MKILLEVFLKKKKNELWMFGNMVLYSWFVLYYKLIFLMRLSDSVSFSVYMKILQIIFLIFQMSRSVNNFREYCVFVFFGICSPPIPIPGVSSGSLLREKSINKWFQGVFFVIFPPPIPISGVSQRFPSGGNKYRIKQFFSDFL